MDFLILREIISNIGVGNLDLYYGRGNRTINIDDTSLNYQIVKRIGGTEGDGEYTERILKFEFPDDQINPVIYIKITGFYSSYDGVDWDSKITRVYPKLYRKLDYFEDPSRVVDDEMPNDIQPII